jgi:hypothetical protein
MDTVPSPAGPSPPITPAPADNPPGPSGFDALFRDRVVPLLAAMESERVATLAARRRWWQAGVGIGVAVAAVIGLWMADVILGLVFGLFAGMAVASGGEGRLLRLRQRVKAGIMPAILAPHGAAYTPDLDHGPSLEAFQALWLVDSHPDDQSFQDMVTGIHAGCAYLLYEAHLVRIVRTRNGTRRRTLFRGLLIRLVFPRAFAGTTLVLRDGGVFNAARDAFTRLDRVGLGDTVFERQFEVLGSDQVEARYLVDPVFMERLMEVETRFAANDIRCAFQDGALHIAFSRQNAFEPDDLQRPLTDPANARRIHDEMVAILDLIDHLVGRFASRAR